MPDAVLVALFSGLCTLVGSLAGVMATTSVTSYRLEGRMDEVEHDVRDLKGYHRPNAH